MERKCPQKTTVESLTKLEERNQKILTKKEDVKVTVTGQVKQTKLDLPKY